MCVCVCVYEFQNCAVRRTGGCKQCTDTVGVWACRRGNSCMGRKMTGQFVRDSDNKVR